MNQHFWYYFNDFEYSDCNTESEIHTILNIFDKKIKESVSIDIIKTKFKNMLDNEQIDIINFLNTNNKLQDKLNFINNDTFFIILKIKETKQIIGTISGLINMTSIKGNIIDSIYVDNLCIIENYRYLKLHYYLILLITEYAINNKISIAFYDINKRINRIPYNYTKIYNRLLTFKIKESILEEESYKTRLYKNLIYTYNYTKDFKESHEIVNQFDLMDRDNIINLINSYKVKNNKIAHLLTENEYSQIISNNNYICIQISLKTNKHHLKDIESIFILNKVNEDNINKYIIKHCYIKTHKVNTFIHLKDVNNYLDENVNDNIELLSEYLKKNYNGDIIIFKSNLFEYKYIKTLKIIENNVISNNYYYTFEEKYRRLL